MVNPVAGGELALISLVFCLVFVVGILGSIFWIWMLVDCAVNEPAGNDNKVIWVIIIALTHLIGALLYFLVRRPQRMAQAGR